MMPHTVVCTVQAHNYSTTHTRSLRTTESSNLLIYSKLGVACTDHDMGFAVIRFKYPEALVHFRMSEKNMSSEQVKDVCRKSKG